MSENKLYSVYLFDRLACQVGDTYSYDYGSAEGEDLVNGVSFEEARKAFDRAVEAWGEGVYSIIRNKTGLDTVEYQVLEICEYDVVEDGELEFVEVVDSARSIPERIQMAMRESECSYWAYLDYESASYHGIVLER